jgi:hypothetical protein
VQTDRAGAEYHGTNWSGEEVAARADRSIGEMGKTEPEAVGGVMGRYERNGWE